MIALRDQAWSTIVELNSQAHRLGEIGSEMADSEAMIAANHDSDVAAFEKVAAQVRAEAVRALLLMAATLQLSGRLEALAEQMKEAERTP